MALFRKNYYGGGDGSLREQLGPESRRFWDRRIGRDGFSFMYSGTSGTVAWVLVHFVVPLLGLGFIRGLLQAGASKVWKSAISAFYRVMLLPQLLLPVKVVLPSRWLTNLRSEDRRSAEGPSELRLHERKVAQAKGAAPCSFRARSRLFPFYRSLASVSRDYPTPDSTAPHYTRHKPHIPHHNAHHGTTGDVRGGGPQEACSDPILQRDRGQGLGASSIPARRSTRAPSDSGRRPRLCPCVSAVEGYDSALRKVS